MINWQANQYDLPTEIEIELNLITLDRIRRIFNVEIFNINPKQSTYSLGHCITYPTDSMNFLNVDIVFFKHNDGYYSGPPNKYPGLECYLQCSPPTPIPNFSDFIYTSEGILKFPDFENIINQIKSNLNN